MKPLDYINCLRNRHSPDRRQVTWDGSHYCGTCTCCGKPIRRKQHNDWRADWLPDRRSTEPHGDDPTPHRP